MENQSRGETKKNNFIFYLCWSNGLHISRKRSKMRQNPPNDHTKFIKGKDSNCSFGELKEGKKKSMEININEIRHKTIPTL